MAMLSAKDDAKLVMMVSNKLMARGIRSPCSVSVTSRNGEVTLSGTVVQAHQKNAATYAAAGIEGVKRVNDRLVVKVAAKRSDDKDGQWAIKAMPSVLRAEAAALEAAKAAALVETPEVSEATAGET